MCNCVFKIKPNLYFDQSCGHNALVWACERGGASWATASRVLRCRRACPTAAAPAAAPPGRAPPPASWSPPPAARISPPPRDAAPPPASSTFDRRPEAAAASCPRLTGHAARGRSPWPRARVRRAPPGQPSAPARPRPAPAPAHAAAEARSAAYEQGRLSGHAGRIRAHMRTSRHRACCLLRCGSRAHAHGPSCSYRREKPVVLFH